MKSYYTISTKANPKGEHEINIRLVISRELNPTSGTGIFILPQYFEYYVNTTKCNNNDIKFKNDVISADQAWAKGIPVKYGNIKINKRIDTEEVIYHREQENKLRKLESHLSDAILTAKSNRMIMDRNWLVSQIDRFHYPEKYLPKEKRKDDKKENLPLTLLQAFSYYIKKEEKHKDELTILHSRSKQKNGGKLELDNDNINQRNISALSKRIIQYKNTEKRIKDFLKLLKKSDMLISELDNDFHRDFRAYLDNEGYTLNTKGKHIKNIKAVLHSLPIKCRIDCKFIEKGACNVDKEDVDNIALSEEDLKAISLLQLSGVHKKVRDQFLLLCWTGCRYSDLDKIDINNIHEIGENARVFILIQQKTEEEVIIPILPEIEPILAEYATGLPKVMTDQAFNRYLKEILKNAEFNEEVLITKTIGGKKQTRKYKKWEVVASHTGRRSFATNMYKRGFDTLSIMAITGHKTEASFLKYIKISKKEKAQRLLNLIKEYYKNQHR